MAIPHEDIMDALAYGFGVPGLSPEPVRSTTATLIGVDSEVLAQFTELYVNGAHSERDKKIEELMKAEVARVEEAKRTERERLEERLGSARKNLRAADARREELLHNLAETPVSVHGSSGRCCGVSRRVTSPGTMPSKVRTLRSVQKRVEKYRRGIQRLEQELAKDV